MEANALPTQMRGPAPKGMSSSAAPPSSSKTTNKEPTLPGFHDLTHREVSDGCPPAPAEPRGAATVGSAPPERA